MSTVVAADRKAQLLMSFLLPMRMIIRHSDVRSRSNDKPLSDMHSLAKSSASVIGQPRYASLRAELLQSLSRVVEPDLGATVVDVASFASSILSKMRPRYPVYTSLSITEV